MKSQPSNLFPLRLRGVWFNKIDSHNRWLKRFFYDSIFNTFYSQRQLSAASLNFNVRVISAHVFA